MKTMMPEASRSQDSNPLRRHASSVSLACILANITLLAVPPALADAPPSDLAATTVSVNTTPAIAGRIIEVSHTVTRSGDEIIQGWADHFYLSTDDVFDGAGTDTYLGSVAVSGEDNYTLTTEVTLPPDAAGKYYLLVVVDAENAVTEYDDSNNVASAPFPITSGYPDLVPESLSTTGEFIVGQPFGFEFNIRNIGISTIGDVAWNDQVYLSADNNLDEGDYPTGEPFTQSSPLDPDTAYTQGRTFWIPAEAAPGQWYLIVTTDTSDNVREAEEQNNTTSFPITVIARPNLRPTYVGPGTPIINNVVAADPAPSRDRGPRRRLYYLNSGQEETIEFDVTNDGSAPAEGTWWDSVYLSPDATLDRGSDIFLGGVFRMGDPVMPWTSYRGSFTANIPQLELGDYYLIVVTDDLYSVTETNEDDNIFVEQVSVVAPDLMPTDCTPANPVLAMERDEDVIYTITNMGEGSVPSLASWYDAIYLSDDAYFDEGDTQLYGAGHEYGPLTSGEPYTRGVTIHVPKKAPGTYYLIVFADYYWNSLFESTDANNVVAFQVTIVAPDLTPSACLPVDTNLLSGRTAEIDCTVANTGTGPVSATTWWDQVFLSEDQFLDGADINIGGGQAAGPVAAGDVYNSRLSVNIPQVREGDYYLIVACDYPNNEVPESDDNNNSTAFPVRIDAVDLRPASIAADGASLKPGSSVAIDFSVTNDGMAPVPDGSLWYDLVYLSRDAVVDWSDTPLVYGPPQTPPMTHGNSYALSVSASLPAVMAPGDWHLIIRADAWWDQVKEGEEANNDLALRFHIGQTEAWWASGFNLHGETSLPEANPAGDGINNLMKYAFGMDPLLAYGLGRVLEPGIGTSGLPAVTLGEDSRLRVEYVRRLAAMDLIYQVQFGSGLGAADWSPAGKGSETTQPIDDEWERVIVTDLDAPANAGTRFARVMLRME